MTDLAALIRALNGGEVEFIVVGGVAAVAHGSARLTQDLDVVYSRSNENLTRLAAALRPLLPYLRDAPPGLPFNLDMETLRAGLNFTLTTSIGDLDLLGEITGGGNYEALLPHTVDLEVFDRKILFLNLEWLIKVKRAAGRPRDLEVIAELESLIEDQQD
jgi:hypothetical protein